MGSNTAKTFFLLLLLTGVVATAGLILLPDMFIVAILLAVLLNLGMYMWSHKIVLLMTRSKPASPENYPQVHSMIQEISANAHIPTPDLYVMKGDDINAFATGRNPKHGVVSVTEGFLKQLNEYEQKGVLAHEIGHILNRDILVMTLAATMAAVVGVAGRAMFYSGNTSTRGRDPRAAMVGVIVLVVLYCVGILVRFAVSRTREYKADQTGAELLGQSFPLANALTKIRDQQLPRHRFRRTNPAVAQLFIANPLESGTEGRNQKPGLLRRLFSTHPPLDDRIERLHNTIL